jgi:hypothetical protein
VQALWRAFPASAPVAQGIERLPPEQKAAGSNPAGGTSVLALQRRFLAAIIDLVPSACHSMCRSPVVISAHIAHPSKGAANDLHRTREYQRRGEPLALARLPTYPGQVECLEAMERHPAYAARPAMVLLEALEFLHPGCVEEYVAGLIAE